MRQVSYSSGELLHKLNSLLKRMTCSRRSAVTHWLWEGAFSLRRSRFSLRAEGTCRP